MSIILFIITTLSHELYKHSKVLYICEIALLLLYTSKRYQKDCGWPLKYKSLSIYISRFLLTLFYLFLLFHNTLLAWVSIQFQKEVIILLFFKTSKVICVVLSTYYKFFFLSISVYSTSLLLRFVLIILMIFLID